MSDMELLNELPQGWKWVKLGDVCYIEMGQSPNGDSYNKNQNGLPLLNGPAEFGKINPTPVQWTTEFTKLAEKGDILFCVRGSTTGKKNIADRTYCIGRGIAAIRGLPDKSDTNFLYLLLDQVTEELLLKTSGSTFPNLSGENLKNFIAPFPPLPEQQRLAKLLTEKLAIVEQAKQTITAQLQAAQDLTAAYLREVFESEEAKWWDLVKFGDVCNISHGYAFGGEFFEKNSKKNFPILLTPGNFMQQGGLYFKEENTKRYSEKYPCEYLLNIGDLVIVMTDLSSIMKILGKPAIINKNNLLHNQRIGKITVNQNLVINEFLFYVFLTDVVNNQIKQEATGSTVRHTSPSKILNVHFILPPVDKQQEIANYLTEKFKTVEQLKATLQTQLESINQLPAALLKQAFNGKL